jgi:hypothetical protein
MRKNICLVLGLIGVLSGTTPAAAQEDAGSSEIIVTASRREGDDWDETIPVVGLRRLADFAVQEVRIVGDTRDGTMRRSEMYTMIRGAIELAAARGNIQLATGEMIVEPLTLANYKDLPMTVNGGRVDTDQTSFLVKTKLSAGTNSKAALDSITAFIKAVKPVGRAQLESAGDMTLSVVRPDQYREQIVDLVSADARATALKFGADYGVEANGLDRPVEWSRASLTEVFLYVPYRYVIRPKVK